MFQNVMSPSQMYQSLFRTLPLVPQPVASTSTSFLVENLIREGHPALMSRQGTTLPTVVSAGLTGVDPSAMSMLGRSMEHVVPATSGNGVSDVTPYLKFGVSAILGNDTDNKPSKYPLQRNQHTTTHLVG